MKLEFCLKKHRGIFFKSKNSFQTLTSGDSPNLAIVWIISFWVTVCCVWWLSKPTNYPPGCILIQNNTNREPTLKKTKSLFLLAMELWFKQFEVYLIGTRIRVCSENRWQGYTNRKRDRGYQTGSVLEIPILNNHIRWFSQTGLNVVKTGLFADTGLFINWNWIA